MSRTGWSLDFRLMWTADAVSSLGSRVSMLAFPTIAVLVLHSGPVAVGVLTMLNTLPLLLLSMLSGVIADRGNRRGLVVGCDVVSMLATGSVPLAAALGHLTLGQLFVTTAFNGAAANLHHITFYSIVPSVVPRSEFDRANARLEGSNVAAAVIGPGVGGGLIQLLGAARAVTADSVSFLVSALLLLRLRDRTRRVLGPAPTSFRHDLVDGARFVFGDRRLRRLALASATSNLGGGLGLAVLLIFLYRNVGLSPGGLGAILVGTGLVGALIAFNAPAICRRFGYARSLAFSAACNGAGWIMLPLATHVAAIPIVVLSYLLGAIENGLWNVSMITLRRSFTPDAMFGRMVASTRTVAQGTLPLGLLVGGGLGAHFGVVPTLMAGGALMAVSGSLALDPELIRVRAPGHGEAVTV
jgi:MFS family permease